MSVFPITFEDKVDSPEFTAWLATFGAEKKMTAAEINLVRDALNELHNTKVPIVGGKIPTEYLPSYVDDVLEFENVGEFPATGEESKIYVDLETNFTYRWSGSVYVQLGGGKKFENHLFSTYGTNTLPNTGVNAAQVKTFNNSVLTNLSTSSGVTETGGNLDLATLAAVGKSRITGNYIGKVIAIEFSYARNVNESIEATNVMLSVTSDSKYPVNMQLIARYNLISTTTPGLVENKITIPVSSHLDLDPFSNIRWCIRTANGVAQTFAWINVNVITQEV